MTGIFGNSDDSEPEPNSLALGEKYDRTYNIGAAETDVKESIDDGFDSVPDPRYTQYVGESVPYRDTYTLDQTTSIQGESPPYNLDMLVKYRNTIAQVDSALELTTNFTVGSQIIINCRDKKAKEFLMQWLIDTDFHARFRSAVAMMFLTGLGLLVKGYNSSGQISRVEDFDVITIERINRDSNGNPVAFQQRLANSGIKTLDARDFVRLVVRPNFRQYWGRALHDTLAHVPTTRGRVIPPHGERMIGMNDAIIGSVENFVHPLTFMSMDGMSDEDKKKFKQKIRDRKPGEMFIGNQIPNMSQMDIRGGTQYAPFIDYYVDFMDHALGTPLDIMKADYASRASSETTNNMFMLKINDYQTILASQILNDIFIPVLHGNGFKDVSPLNISVTFRSYRPVKYTPEQVVDRVNSGIWTVKEARAYDKNEGQDLFDDEEAEKREEEDRELEKKQAEKPMMPPASGSPGSKNNPKHGGSLGNGKSTGSGQISGSRKGYPSDAKPRAAQTPKPEK